MSGPAPAKYATARTPGLKSYGARAAALSDVMGAPFMPWQRQVADVALEVHPTIPGAWRYRVVIVTVPRQAGKTTLLRAVGVDRALAGPGVEVFLTAQTGKDARARWRDWVKAVTASSCALSRFAKARRAAGTEALTFPNASSISPFAPTSTSLHGYTPPLVMVDEAWAFDAAAGAELEAAIGPAQITRDDRQLWIVSTMGDAGSTWFHDMIDKARASVGDPTTDVAFFEWSAAEGVDPYSREALAFHPALGYTQTVDDLLAEQSRNTPGNYRRGFLNLRTTTRESAVDLVRWDSLVAPAHDTPALSSCALAYAVAGDRSGSSLWAAHKLADGRPCLHLVATRAGSAWVAPTVLELRNAGPRAIAADTQAGHTRAVTATLGTDGVEVDAVTGATYATACASLLGRIADGTIAHDGSPELRAALEVAALAPMAGGRGFADNASAGPIDHLKAATLAAFTAEHLSDAVPIYF